MFGSAHSHTFFSTLDAICSPEALILKCKELGYKGCAITDHGSLSGVPDFVKAAKENGIKPIIGVELYICDQDSTVKTPENRKLQHLVVLAKNLQGWKQLLKICRYSNEKAHFYYKPRLSLNELRQFSNGNLIGISGHIGSNLSRILFKDWSVTRAEYNECGEHLVDGYMERCADLAKEFNDLFRGNFFIETQLFDEENLPVQRFITEILRKVSKDTGIRRAATFDSHYLTREDQRDQLVVLCSTLKTTISKVREKLENDEDVSLGGFFRSKNYYVIEPEVMDGLHDDDEIRAVSDIFDSCEVYDIFSKPKLPKFTVPPEFPDSNSYLKELCRRGWRKRFKGLSKEQAKTYGDRAKHEMEVLENAGLSDYFLMIGDVVGYIKSKNGIISPGRGSVAGCLVAYLLEITEIDPIKYDLMFERFFNASRASSLPDIDLDFRKQDRETVIEYVKKKYGEDKVAHICTFGRIMGRGALKEVLRAHEVTSFTEMNRICEGIENESKISDQLGDMKDAKEKPSAILWSLRNQPKDLQEWCHLEDGELNGNYAKYFQQAMRIEGVIKTQGIHAAGVIISESPLVEVCPLVHNKNSEDLVTGCEMNACENLGLVKCDFLGLVTLDEISRSLELI